MNGSEMGGLWLGPYLQGIGMGASLIIAIGAQNAFVLTQGVRRNSPWIVAAICSACDAALIGVGVAGVGTAVASNPVLGQFAAWFGAAFLFWYGAGALRSVLRGGALTGDAPRAVPRSVVLSTLAVTLLNPHVYLDTVVLVGAISGQYPGTARYVFGVGAMTASVVWFFSLSLGGQLLAPVFRSRTAWRVLDGLVCVIMWTLGTRLFMHGLRGGVGM